MTSNYPPIDSNGELYGGRHDSGTVQYYAGDSGTDLSNDLHLRFDWHLAGLPSLFEVDVLNTIPQQLDEMFWSRVPSPFPQATELDPASADENSTHGMPYHREPVGSLVELATASAIAHKNFQTAVRLWPTDQVEDISMDTEAVSPDWLRPTVCRRHPS